ncbi:hypothetical protein ZIOFF_044722 [Zingiber officinale]|uniref:Uncharacterized protein n=1 Tax=Zingiber officinale TaxID=94328 RepID=A0A8J5FVS6_ZINOF|nr:hypothetical protein ZIOFF_044722 [Zingiber officinale]
MGVTGKVASAVWLLLLVAAVDSLPSEDPWPCFCPCMKDQCMVIPGVTKEICAGSCDRGCRNSGVPGQPNPNEFCGF